MGAPSCIAPVRHCDQPSTNILKKEILFEKSPEWALACGIREDKGGIKASHLGMLGEYIQGIAGKRHRTCLTVLGLLEGQQTTFEIDIRPAQIKQFTTSTAGG